MNDLMTKARLDREYNAFLAAEGFDKDGIYRARSEAALQRLPERQTFAYDDAPGAVLDYYGAMRGAPLFVWFHGGYWRSSSKDENVFVVPGLASFGINVACVDYALAPSVSIDEIVRQARQSIAWLFANAASLGFDCSRIHIGGHSAGGHLVGMLLAEGWLPKLGLPPDLFGVALSVSGLFELKPLRDTFVNEQLDLTETQIEICSPIRHVPYRSSALLLVAVGGKESAEFSRQTSDYLDSWIKSSNRGRQIEMTGFHHFDIILELERPGNPLFDALIEEFLGSDARTSR